MATAVNQQFQEKRVPAWPVPSKRLRATSSFTQREHLHCSTGQAQQTPCPAPLSPTCLPQHATTAQGALGVLAMAAVPKQCIQNISTPQLVIVSRQCQEQTTFSRSTRIGNTTRIWTIRAPVKLLYAMHMLSVQQLPTYGACKFNIAWYTSSSRQEATAKHLAARS